MTEILMNKHRVKKRFKRYLSHNAGTGLDTGHRDMAVSEDEMRIRWCITWHYRKYDRHWSFDRDACNTCGTTGEEIHPYLHK